MSKIKEEIKNDEKKIEQKLKTVSPARLTILIIMLVITVCSFVFYDYLFSADPNVNVFLDPNSVELNADGEVIKEATPNTGSLFLDSAIMLVPTLLKCIQSITVLLTIATIIVIIIKKAFRKTQRGITVASLICNMINWLTALIIVIIVLSGLGVDTTALITGAGVVTLVVGLGMQSLIADIVAGLFIIFENQFNVGDYITIDDFRGKVLSIGIRTTRVMDGVNNVKIFNNNSIQGVINHDMELSVAKTFIDIEYGSKIPKVEQIIKDHLAELNIPDAMGPVEYQGVSALGASGVTLLFTASCHEKDIFAVARAMNGAIKNMFDENGIGIPFPQVVVHHGNDKDE